MTLKDRIKELRINLDQITKLMDEYTEVMPYAYGLVTTTKIELLTARSLLRLALHELGEYVPQQTNYSTPSDLEQDTDICINSTLASQFSGRTRIELIFDFQAMVSNIILTFENKTEDWSYYAGGYDNTSYINIKPLVAQCLLRAKAMLEAYKIRLKNGLQ